MLRKIFSKITGKPEQELWNDALRSAAIKGRLSRVKKLLSEGADPDYKDVNALTPLYFAARGGFAAVARLMLEHGADPDAGKNAKWNCAVITEAAYDGHVDVVRTLLEFKADINARGRSERTALHNAVWNGQAAAALFLLEAGADPNTRDSNLGHTPLQDALLFGHRPLALKLAEKGADPAVTDKRGNDLRKAAALKGWDDVVEAIDRYREEAERQNRRRAEEGRQRQENLNAAIEQTPVLQKDLVVKKPLAFKPRP